MQKIVNVVSALVFLALLAACSPMGPLPGGELSGNVRDVPSDWSASKEMPIVQIETRPDDPYSINIWGVSEGRNFYVGSGAGEESNWAGHLAEDPKIRLRLGQAIYELTAVRVRDEAERAMIRDLYAAKYEDFEGQVESEEESAMVVFRLDPR